jgi:hypothetical protein
MRSSQIDLDEASVKYLSAAPLLACWNILRFGAASLYFHPVVPAKAGIPKFEARAYDR